MRAWASRCLVAAACLVASTHARAQAAPEVGGASAFLEVRTPGALAWSPDGRSIAAYLSNARDGEILVFPVDGGAPRRVVTGLPRLRRYKDRPEIRWSPDGNRLVYRQGTMYYTVSASGGQPVPLVRDSLPREIVVLSPDQRAMSFVNDGDLWVQALSGGPPRRLTEGQRFLAAQAEFYGRFTQWTPWSPDGARLTFLASAPAGGLRVGVVEVATGSIRWLTTPGPIWDYVSVAWAPDGTRLAVSRLSRDFRIKQLVLSHAITGETVPLREDTDSLWVSHNIDPSFGPAWSPDGSEIAYISNRSGWRQLLVTHVSSNATRPVTKPGYDVASAAWSPDGAQLLALSNRDDRHSVRPWIIPLEGGDARLLVPGAGTVEDAVARGRIAEPEWAPNGGRLAFVLSDAEDPFQLRVAAPAGARTVWSAVESGFPVHHSARTEAVAVPARDGAAIPALLLRPRAVRGRRPVLVFHYGGWGQMARVGWGLGVKSRLFQYLVSRGWLVLLVDPRGSEGYGRAHAQGLYLEGGGTQADDLADAARYLRSRRDVDPGRIALFGHSYGAYLALTTLLRSPGAFQAGVLLAGVFDFRPLGDNTYVRIRFGDVRGASAVPSRQVAPAAHVADLRAPVLVYHGTNDFNAPIGFSEQLVRQLLLAGRDFEYMVYPDEPHDWQRYETDRDFLVRTERFLASLSSGRDEGGRPTAVTGRRP